MWRVLISLVLILHSLIHLLGVAVYWRLVAPEGMTDPGALLGGRLAAPAALVQLFGLLWLVATAGFVVGGAGLMLGQPWWRPAVGATALLSLAICAAGWPDARVGVVVNVVILAALLIGPDLLPLAAGLWHPVR